MDSEELWTTWKRLTRLLPIWRMPFEWILSPSVYTLFGVDFVSGLRRNQSTRAVAEILAELPVAELRRVRAVAELNHRRQEAVSRWFAVGAVTVPASAALTLSELSPATLRAIAASEGPTRWYLVLSYVGAVVVYYLLCAWRARQLLTVIEIHCIDRGVLGSEGASMEDALHEPLNP